MLTIARSSESMAPEGNRRHEDSIGGCVTPVVEEVSSVQLAFVERSVIQARSWGGGRGVAEIRREVTRGRSGSAHARDEHNRDSCSL